MKASLTPDPVRDKKGHKELLPTEWGWWHISVSQHLVGRRIVTRPSLVDGTSSRIARAIEQDLEEKKKVKNLLVTP